MDTQCRNASDMRNMRLRYPLSLLMIDEIDKSKIAFLRLTIAK